MSTRCACSIVAVAAIALFGSRCSKDPTPSTPPAESVQSKASATGATVVGKGPPASGGFSAIIVLEPQTPREFPAPTVPKVMDQLGLTFVPGLILVRQGQPVVFRNSEDVLHNVRVQETGKAQPVFNVATIPGNSYTHTFEQPGFYSVGCDVHETMHADILVTSTPYAVVADEDGRFTLSDVSPGSYKLTVYLGSQRIERLVEVTGSRTELVVNQ